jgi:hypothetical protein
MIPKLSLNGYMAKVKVIEQGRLQQKREGSVQMTSSLMDSLHWQHLSVKPSATGTRDSHYSTCLGHLGLHDTDRIISF